MKEEIEELIKKWEKRHYHTSRDSEYEIETEIIKDLKNLKKNTAAPKSRPER